MKIINFGSINFDRTYRVHRFPETGETLQTQELICGCGGKGLNQSIAISRAGGNVTHAGTIGNDGASLQREMEENGVDCAHLMHVDSEQGHAVILVNDQGDNEILVHRGSNLMMTTEYIDGILSSAQAPALVLLQNEIPHADHIIDQAHEKGFEVVFNASPVNEEMVSSVNFSHVCWLLINEVEGEQLTAASDPEDILDYFEKKSPEMNVVLTLGTDGSVGSFHGSRFQYGSYQVPVKDTTGAGDTYTGYFLAGIAGGKAPEESMKTATLAAAVSVTRSGAASAIPMMEEVEACDREGSYDLRI